MMGAEQQKFKVGDRVKRFAGKKIDGMDIGDVGTVSACSAIGEWIGITEFPAGNGDLTPFSAYNFELVPAWQPKVGDRVVWREPFNSPFYTKGNTYEIKSSRNGYLFLTDDNRNAESGNHQWGVSEISSSFDLAPATLTIEAGKFYKTRDGRKVGPIESDGETAWGKSPAGYATVFVSTGLANYEGEHKDDFIAEWVDEPAAPVAASNDNAAPAKFKVGDVVRFKDSYEMEEIRGVKATVVRVNEWGVQINTEQGFGLSTESVDSIELVTTTPAIVAIIEDGVAKPATKPRVHSSQTDATAEAERLALLHPGQEFGVFVLAGSKIADVVEEVVKKTVLRAA